MFAHCCWKYNYLDADVFYCWVQFLVEIDTLLTKNALNSLKLAKSLKLLFSCTYYISADFSTGH